MAEGVPKKAAISLPCVPHVIPRRYTNGKKETSPKDKIIPRLHLGELGSKVTPSDIALVSLSTTEQEIENGNYKQKAY